jgi:hypothetical protein
VKVFGAGVKLKPDVDLAEYGGHCIQIGLVSVLGVLVMNDIEIFPLCFN